MFPPVTSAPKSRNTTAAQHVQPGMRAHEGGSPGSSTAPRTTCPGAERITVPGHQVEVVALARVHDAGLHTTPQQHPVVRRLTAAAGIEGRPVEHDPVWSGVKHDRVPFAQRLVV